MRTQRDIQRALRTLGTPDDGDVLQGLDGAFVLGDAPDVGGGGVWTKHALQTDLHLTDGASPVYTATDLSIPVEANTSFYVQGCLKMHDPSQFASCVGRLNVPTGTRFFFNMKFSQGSYYDYDYWSHDRTDEVGHPTTYQFEGVQLDVNGKAYMFFEGYLAVGGTGGNITLDLFSKAGNSTPVGLDAGSLFLLSPMEAEA